MGDLTIKPANDGHLKLQNDAGTTILEMANDESKLRLAQNNISASDGTTAITTSGANVTLAGTANNIGTVTAGTFNGTIGSSATGDGIITCAETFRLDANTSAGTSFTLSGWTKYNDFGAGTSITESGGNFTTSSTGFYYISVGYNYYASSSTPTWIDSDVYSWDGSSSTHLSRSMASINNTSGYISANNSFVYDWTSTSDLIQVRVSAQANIIVNGSSSSLRTRINFLKIGST